MHKHKPNNKTKNIGFRALAPLYYRDASGALIVFDITRRETFEKVKSWLDELDSKESVPLVRFLVGSKKDLESQREVTQNEVINIKIERRERKKLKYKMK